MEYLAGPVMWTVVGRGGVSHGGGGNFGVPDWVVWVGIVVFSLGSGLIFARLDLGHWPWSREDWKW